MSQIVLMTRKIFITALLCVGSIVFTLETADARDRDRNLEGRLVYLKNGSGRMIDFFYDGEKLDFDAIDEYREPVFSPDGRFIAAVSHGQIMIITYDGDSVDYIDVETNAKSLHWSQMEDNHLYYETYDTDNQSSEVYLINLDNGDTEKVYETKSGARVNNISTSKNSTKLLITQEGIGKGVYLVDADGKRELVNELAIDSYWFPDGEHVSLQILEKTFFNKVMDKDSYIYSLKKFNIKDKTMKKIKTIDTSRYTHLSKIKLTSNGQYFYTVLCRSPKFYQEIVAWPVKQPRKQKIVYKSNSGFWRAFKYYRDPDWYVPGENK